MGRRLVIVVAILAGALLLAIGVIAGILIGRDDNADSTTSVGQAIATSTPAASPGATRTPASTSTTTPTVTPTPQPQAYLGVTVTVINGNGGLRVATVEANGPAAQAGIQVGDTIRSVDSQVVRTPEQLRAAVESHRPGDQVNITYERGDREMRAQAKLIETPASARATPSSSATPSGTPSAGPQANRGGRLGVAVQQITPALKTRLGLTRDEGVVVTEVLPNSVAAKAGIQVGDIVASVNSTNITSAADLQRVLIAIPANESAAILIQRKDAQVTVQTSLPPVSNLEGIANLLPEELRRSIQDLLDKGALAPEQLQSFLRLYQARGDFLQIGRVKSVNPGIVSPTWIITMTPETGGDDVTVSVDGRTSIIRGATTIQPGDLKENELIVTISLDTTGTAIRVIATGKTD